MIRKKLIIVCDDQTISYGNYLKQLISTKDDEDDKIIGVKDGSMEVVIWLEKHYIANMPTISSNQHILFIGNNKITKTIKDNINMSFSRFGINYGWLGKDLVLYVDRVLDGEEYDQFLKYSEEYQKKFQKAFYEKKWEMIGWVLGWTAHEMIRQINRSNFNRKVMEQQYTFGILYLYLNGLSDFLEG